MKNIFKKLFGSNSWGKHFSETVQRVGKNNAGFSLVELIVVIAIMAVLAAVAVIGVSIYIPKAQKAADEQMIADIEQALTLYYYSNPDAATDGVLVLNVEGEAQSNDKFIIDAMQATYGDDWKTELSLKYGEWSATFQGSNFYGDGQQLSELLGTVETLTEALGNFINNPVISNALGDNFNDYMTGLNANSASEKADAAVFYVADITADLSPDALQNAANAMIANSNNATTAMGAMNQELGSTIASAAALYAMAEGYASFFEASGYKVTNANDSRTPRQILTQATADIESKSGNYASTAVAFEALMEAFNQMGQANDQAIADYMDGTNGNSPLNQDLNAYADAMKTVSSSKNDIITNNGAALGTDGYFSSNYITGLVDSYANGGVFIYVKLEDNGIKITSSSDTE